MVGFIILVLFSALLVFIYWFITKEFGYLESQGVKVIKKPTPYFGTEDFLSHKPRHLKDLELYNKFGKIFGMYEGRKATLVVADPDLMKRVFVEDFHTFPHKKPFIYKNTHPSLHQCVLSLRNEPWRRTHTVLAQIFSFDKVKQLLPLMSESAEELVDQLKSIRNDSVNGEIEMSRLAFLFSVSIVAKTVFAIDENMFVQSNDHPFVKNAKAILEPKEIDSWAEKFFPNLFPYQRNAIKYFVDLARKTIYERKERMAERNNSRFDFTQLLLDAQEDEEMLLRNPLAKILHQKLPKALPDKMIIAHVVIFIFVAIQPVASAVVYALYSLARHGEIQETAANEIAKHISDNDEIVDTSVLAKLRYTDTVITEVLRMYPPLIRNERLCVQPYRLRTCVLKPGMSVIIPVYCIHHDPDFYPNPEEFEPNRFSDKSPRHRPLTYLPFGLGPRRCIGKDFALLEIKVALIYLLQNFHLKLSAKSENLESKVVMSYLKPANGLWLQLTEKERKSPRPASFLLQKFLSTRKRRRSSDASQFTPNDHDNEKPKQSTSFVKISTRERLTETTSDMSFIPDVYTIENTEIVLANDIIEHPNDEVD